MKLMFASDIHGSSYYANRVVEIFEKEQAENLILLGDILYHGPRNDLPKDYDPKKVIALLNPLKEKLLCVRGNCDGEVDQMVLDFPILADYIMLFLDGKRIYLSHGHVYNPENPMPLQKGDILINGHTHVHKAEEKENFTYINPGSVSIPKENQVPSYMIYQDKTFFIKDLDGNILCTYEVVK